jgi:two-component system nitrogen regulation response regulator NtrX
VATILVVDDDSQILSLLSEVLDEAGHSTLTTTTAAEGLLRFSDGSPDLVLLDLKLPDGDGMDLLREMCEKKPETIVIIVSAISAMCKAGEAVQRGAYDYIEKPLEMNRVLIAVRNALEVKRLRSGVDNLETKGSDECDDDVHDWRR